MVGRVPVDRRLPREAEGEGSSGTKSTVGAKGGLVSVDLSLLWKQRGE